MGINVKSLGQSFGDLAGFVEGSGEGNLGGALVVETKDSNEAGNMVANIGLLLRATRTPGVTAINGERQRLLGPRAEPRAETADRRRRGRKDRDRLRAESGGAGAARPGEDARLDAGLRSRQGRARLDPDERLRRRRPDAAAGRIAALARRTGEARRGEAVPPRRSITWRSAPKPKARRPPRRSSSACSQVCLRGRQRRVGSRAMEPWLRGLYDAEGMRSVDRWAIEDQGVDSLELMENAGRAVAEAVARLAPAGPVRVVCGKGNNGGDGLVAARLLREMGFEAEVLLLWPADELSEDATREPEAAARSGRTGGVRLPALSAVSASVVEVEGRRRGAARRVRRGRRRDLRHRLLRRAARAGRGGDRGDQRLRRPGRRLRRRLRGRRRHRRGRRRGGRVPTSPSPSTAPRSATTSRPASGRPVSCSSRRSASRRARPSPPRRE